MFTLLFHLFCEVVFTLGKTADRDKFQWTTPNIMQLRGSHGRGTNVYQQPVASGENIVLSCSALGKTFTQSFLYLAWSARSPAKGSSTVYMDWEFIGGMNSTRHPYVKNPQRNAIDWKGFLSIRSVSKDKNGKEYRCIVKKDMYIDPDASFVKLFVLDETAFPTPRTHVTCTTDVTASPTTTTQVTRTTEVTGKHSTASPTPRTQVTRTTDVTSKHSRTSPTPRTQVMRETDVTDKHSTGPTKSIDHERGGISSNDVGKAFGIGAVVGVVVGVVLAYVFYKYERRRSELRRLISVTSHIDAGIDYEMNLKL